LRSKEVLLHLRHPQIAVLVIEPAGQEVMHLLRPAADLQPARTAITGRERRRDRISKQIARVELRDRAFAGNLLPWQTLSNRARRCVRTLRVVLARIVRDILALAFFIEEAPLRSASLGALCRYSNDAIGRLGAIQRRGRRPFHDPDA